MKRMTMNAAVALAVLCAASANADFTGTCYDLEKQWTGPDGTKYNVFRVYANFDEPAQVSFWGGSPDNPMEITTQPEAEFYQFQFSGDALPQPGNELYKKYQAEFDHSSFVTIGVEAGYDPESDIGDIFQLVPGVNIPITQPSWGTNKGGVVSEPGAPNTLTDENGQVLLAQLTIPEGISFWGTGILQYSAPNGEDAGVEIIEFGQFSCSSPCPVANLNDDFVVDTLDLLALLEQWGTCESCDADLNDDGVVGVLDLIELLDSWGPCEFSQ